MNAKMIMLAVAVAVIGAAALMMCDDSDAAAGDVIASGEQSSTRPAWKLTSLNDDDSQLKLSWTGSNNMYETASAYIGYYSYRTTIVELDLSEWSGTSISRVFLGGSLVTTVSIPEGVTEIGNDSFSSMSHLTAIHLPSTLKTIGSKAFSSTKITELIIPEGVTTIGGQAVRDCSALRTISIPDTITSTDSLIFAGSAPLEKIRMPMTTTNILSGASWSNISEIVLGADLSGGYTESTTVNMPWYLARNNLQSITFADDNIPAYILYGQNLDTLTITNASGPDVLGIYTAPNTKATASALTVDGTAAQIVRLTDVRGAAELLDGGINLNDVDVHWDTSPDGYATGEVDASPEVLVYPAGIHTSAPNQYAGLINAIPLIVIVAIITTIIGMMAVRRD